MHKTFPLAVAALLTALSPAYAVNPPKADASKMALHKDSRTAPATPVLQEDDATTNVIILDPDSLQALPNPYANPAPRMISDVWAMRT